ncbi:unnamed protein product [Cunninghamella echinulata]
MITKYQKTILFILIQLLLKVTSDEVIIDKITKDVYTTNIVTTEYDIKNMNTIIYEDTILDIELINNNDDDEDDDEEEEEDDDDQEQDHDDTDDEQLQQQPLQLDDDVEGKLNDDSLNKALYGLLHPQQEIGDDLSEELVEYDDDSNEDNQDETTLLYEDDEAPLDFKNNESIDLDQLLFESSQKDSPLEWDYQPEEGQEEENQQQQDELIEQQKEEEEEYITKEEETTIEHEEETIIQQDSLFNQLETDYKQEKQNEDSMINHDHDNSFIIDNTNNYNDIDQVLASADDALFMDAQDDDEEIDHPDHISDDQLNVLIEQQQQQQTTMDSEDIIHPSNSKMIIFGVLVLLVLLYKNKSIQGYKYKFFAKEDGLPLHNKDLDTPDMTTLLNKRENNQTQEIYPSPSNSYSYLGRRSSVSSITSVTSISSLNGRLHHHPTSSSSTSSNGHVRKLSSTHHSINTIKESKWEGDWNDKVDKHKQ